VIINSKINAILIALLLAVSTCFGEVPQDHLITGNCSSYALHGNLVVFTCDNQVQVQLKQISQGIFKLWFSTNQFKSADESFAVINQGNNSIALNVTGQSGSYEMYTGDLIIRINKSPFQIRIFDKYQKLLMEDIQGLGFVQDSLKITTFKTLKPDERIYGLGEKNGPINRVGGSFKFWNSDQPCYPVNEDPLYKSIPFFMSSEGYGIFFDNTYKSTFDFETHPANTYSFSSDGGELVYYFIYGPTFKQLITRYTELTGKAIMPAAWALGFAQCRGLLTNEKLTREIATTYREKQIPCDIIYQDIGWTEYLQDFEWKKSNYTNPKQMVKDLSNQGFKLIVSQDPVISQENTKQWHEADSLGYFATDVRTGKTYDMPWPWGGNCGVVDFTNPEVADWWGKNQQKVIDDGVRGFWTDMGEPAWSNEESTDRLFMKHQAGMHNKIHNVYGLTWDKVVTEQFEKRNPNKRIFQMTRAGFAGLQRYTFGWSGDSGNGNDVTQGWNKLAAQIPLAMSSGMGLIPFWSCDISGYCGDITDYESFSELYIRWLQFGAFNPLSRIHHEGNNAVEPWLFGDEAEQICKSAIELKYQLFPYIYTYAREAYDTGWPLIRALVLEYPDDEATYNLNSEFLFGAGLLVAPVVEEGAASKKIYLPKGEWIDFTDKTTSYPGKQWIDYPVTLEHIPVFVRKGSIIPQMPVMQYINEYPDYPLILEVFPASVNKTAQFEVYEDDGETNDYKRDAFVKRHIQCSSKKEGFEIIYQESIENQYQPKSRTLIYNIHLEQKPASVTLSGKKIKPVKQVNIEDWNSDKNNQVRWRWNQTNSVCTIRVPSGAISGTILIEK